MNEISKIEKDAILNNPELHKGETNESFVEQSSESYKEKVEKSSATGTSVFIETSQENTADIASGKNLVSWGIGYAPERVITSVENLSISNSKKWIAALFEKLDGQKAS